MGRDFDIAVARRALLVGVFVRPVIDMTKGQPISWPSLLQVLAACVITAVAFGIVGALQAQIYRLRRDLHTSLVIQTAVIEGLPKNLNELTKRIGELEARNDIHGLRELLTQRGSRQRSALASLDEFRNTVLLDSPNQGPKDSKPPSR